VQFANQNLKLSPGIRIQEAKLGGTYGQVRANTVGGEIHHMPADSVSPLSTAKGPAIWMQTLHHRRTGSNDANGRGDAELYRDVQKRLIQSGHFNKAMEMDIKDVQTIAPGLYDIPIRQMQKKYNLKQGK
jgi:hypothetical protein